MIKNYVPEHPGGGVDPDMAWGIGKYALQLQEKERKEAEKKEKAKSRD